MIRLCMSHVARPRFDRKRRYGFKLGTRSKQLEENFIYVTKVSTNGRMYASLHKAISIVRNLL